jgi:hypothetical protein
VAEGAIAMATLKEEHAKQVRECVSVVYWYSI